MVTDQMKLMKPTYIIFKCCLNLIIQAQVHVVTLRTHTDTKVKFQTSVHLRGHSFFFFFFLGGGGGN